LTEFRKSIHWQPNFSMQREGWTNSHDNASGHFSQSWKHA